MPDSEPRRPDPDALVARAAREAAQTGTPDAAAAASRRGRMKVFFGASPGVGKTYAMLQAAHARRAEGVDVVVACVETHGRPETGALLEGLPVLPRRKIEHRGIVLEEMDVDAVLARRPGLALVDELAHTNAPGCRHAKRWQDVAELLDAGIDVLTTLNVQHVESLNDVVAKVTGVIVRETVPDAFLDGADEMTLVDLPPAELLRRLKEGKVYVPERAERALSRFFQEGNLIALRELALRRTAERVDAELLDWRDATAVEGVWATTDRLLVCVGPSPFSARIVRAARRMAAGLKAPWIAVWVRTPATARLTAEDRARAEENLRLAQRLGAEVTTLDAESVAHALLEYARERQVTKIVVGKPAGRRLLSRWKPSLVDALVEGSGDVDVYVITGDLEEPGPRPSTPVAPVRGAGGVAGALAVIAGCTGVAAFLEHEGLDDTIVMVYLLGVVLSAWRLGRLPSIVTAVLGVAAFDYFFVPPHFTFAVSDVRHLFTFAVLLAVGLLVSTLTGRLRDQAESSASRERRTSALLALSRDLAARRDREVLLPLAAGHVSAAFGAPVLVAALRAPETPVEVFDVSGRAQPLSAEAGLIRWAIDHGSAAGRGTDTLPGAEATVAPMSVGRGVVGALVLRLPAAAPAPSLESIRLLETFAVQIAGALERTWLTEEAEGARIAVETERLRNAVLSSVSHDLRTPLAGILGAASGLQEGEGRLSPATRAELVGGIRTEAERLDRVLANLLDMTRLEAGAVTPHKEWQPIEEVVGSALNRLERKLEGRRVDVDVPADLPLIPVDALLIEQVLVNLLENAIRHTPPGTPIEVGARPRGGREVLVRVSDRGPGLPPGEEERVFEKFHRAAAPGVPGTGLGLSVCRGLVRVHGGTISARNREGGGACFEFTIPIEGTPPGAAPEAPSRPGELRA